MSAITTVAKKSAPTTSAKRSASKSSATSTEANLPKKAKQFIVASEEDFYAMVEKFSAQSISSPSPSKAQLAIEYNDEESNDMEVDSPSVSRNSRAISTSESGYYDVHDGTPSVSPCASPSAQNRSIFVKSKNQARSTSPYSEEENVSFHDDDQEETINEMLKRIGNLELELKDNRLKQAQLERELELERKKNKLNQVELKRMKQTADLAVIEELQTELEESNKENKAKEDTIIVLREENAVLRSSGPIPTTIDPFHLENSKRIIKKAKLSAEELQGRINKNSYTIAKAKTDIGDLVVKLQKFQADTAVCKIYYTAAETMERSLQG